MATFYSDQYPTRLPPASVVDGSRYLGNLKRAEASYTMVGTEAAADVVKLFFAKKGTVIIPQLSYVFVETDAAVTLTCDVGDLDTAAADYKSHTASDADRYADGVDIGAVGVDAFASGAAATTRHVLQEDCWITATFATLSTPAAGGLIRWEIVYVDGGAA